MLKMPKSVRADMSGAKVRIGGCEMRKEHMRVQRDYCKYSGIIIAAIAGSAVLAESARAATATWSGAVDDNWSESGNWSGGSPSGQDAVFNNTDPTAAGVVNNVIGTDITVNSLTYQQTGGNRHVTEIAEGATITVSGAAPFPGDSTYQGGNSGTLISNNVFRIGTQLDSANSASLGNLAANVEITGAGSFQVNASAANFLVSSSSTNAGNTISAVAPTTLDMSGLANFDASVDSFWVGTGRASKATVYLAETNSITATSTVIGRTLYRLNQTTADATSALYLGTTNNLNTNTILVGADIHINMALKNRYGAPKHQEDLTVDFIEVMQKSEQLQVVPAPFTAKPQLSGSATAGNTVTCTPNVKDVTDLRYYWFADGYPLTWGTSNTFKISDAEAGKQIRCMVKAVGAVNAPEAWSDTLR